MVWDSGGPGAKPGSLLGLLQWSSASLSLQKRNCSGWKPESTGWLLPDSLLADRVCRRLRQSRGAQWWDTVGQHLENAPGEAG